MKTLFIIVFFFMSLVASASDTLVTNTDFEKLVDKYSSKTADLIRETAEKLEQPAIEVFSSIVRMQTMKGITLLSFTLLTILIVIITVIKWNKASVYYKKSKEEKYCSEDFCNIPGGSTSILFLCISIVCSFCALFATYYGVLYITGAKWYAIMEILNAI